jgi:hypothetical protein
MALQKGLSVESVSLWFVVGEIRKAFRVLSRRLNDDAKPYRRKIAYRGANFLKTVQWHPKYKLWSLIDRERT